MSRIGRAPITIPGGVSVVVGENNEVTVKGPKGSLTRALPPAMTVSVADNTITVTRPSDSKQHRSLHGLTRTLLANMVTGVSQGFSRNLEIVGVGYRAAKTGSKLTLSLGYSHPVEVEPPAGIMFDVPAPNKIVVAGIDKEMVGAMAAKIRSYREPEPYKGKGIRYEGENVRRKAGKAGAKGKK
ncbi:MAG: 50S ribosomal protein L6 [Negativicutes bacterium]|nr:50S ribosomal protein L6 [Negativicutes bacterium]